LSLPDAVNIDTVAVLRAARRHHHRHHQYRIAPMTRAVMATEKLSSTTDVMGNDSTAAHAKLIINVAAYVSGDTSKKPNAPKYASNL
jgi:hypothetical protein